MGGGAHTYDHPGAHVAEFRLLAVVVLELVGPVVDRFDQFDGGTFVLLLFLHLFVVNEVNLQERGGEIGTEA